MNREEIIAEKYFKSLGYNNIKFEPNGNRTPDFAINDQIAVEVRRLNKFHNQQPLEKVEFKLIPKITNQIESFGSGNHNGSAFFGIRYSRPINYNRQIKERINSALHVHASKMDSYAEYHITDNLTLDIFPSTKKLRHQYNLGSYIDLDKSGFVVSKIHNSLKVIIPEKKMKIEKHKTDYHTWWLALIDNIGYGLNEFELNQLRKSIDFNLGFDKVFIIPPLDPIRGKEI